MSFLTRWFSKKEPEDYEQVLASLALDIQKRQTRLSEIRLRERRSTLLFSVYALAFWAVYGTMWYMKLLPNLSGHSRNSKFEKAVQSIPVFVGPIVILFVRRIVQIWYTRTGDKEERLLVTLRKQQREKIEQIKKQTNYYTTRNLLERYDDGSSAVTPDSPQLLRRRAPPQGVPVTPQRPTARSPQKPSMLSPAPVSPSLQQQLSPSPQRLLPPPRKQWFDKLADAILGDDDASASAASRYALICQKCFAHNGLVKESMWEDAQFVCMKCGHLNPSSRTQRSGGGPPEARSPDSRMSPERPQSFAPPVGADGPAPGRRQSSGAGGAGGGAEDGGSARMDVDP